MQRFVITNRFCNPYSGGFRAEFSLFQSTKLSSAKTALLLCMILICALVTQGTHGKPGCTANISQMPQLPWLGTKPPFCLCSYLLIFFYLLVLNQCLFQASKPGTGSAAAADGLIPRDVKLFTVAESEHLWALTWSVLSSLKQGHGPWAKAGSRAGGNIPPPSAVLLNRLTLKYLQQAWEQSLGHPVFKFRHELKYLTESLGVTFTVEQPVALNGLYRATQSTANVKFSARLCMDKATETERWTGVKCIWTSGEQPQLLMASAVIP